MTAIAPTGSATTTVHPSKNLNRTLWTLQIVLGLFFIIASGLPKLVGQEDAVRIFHDIGLGEWFRYFTGVVEIAGGVGLLVPRLSGLASAGLSITVVCAAATQAFILGAPALAVFPLVLVVVFGWIAWQRRDSILAMREMLSR
ncbi:DoxX family protein [Nocardia australiensis]|uniref:DoxX family protein n=1 Tax=Nocardia australiensis TaxID=2887191 RepID=UPI001D13A174|nr:DoxX family protein [Nocardia australiensis]